ncbi:MAG: aminotransferase class V-fold PLP-dependent enzyme [Nitrospirales bacterium]
MLYLNPAGLSPFHPDVQREVTKTLDIFSRELYSESGIKLYREILEQSRRTIASWLELEESQQIAFVPNTTTACSLTLSRIHWKSGDILLTTTHENSTILHEIDALQNRGVRILSLDPDATIGFLPALERTLNEHIVRAIVISHVSHLDGRIFPLASIQALARTHRALFIVDGAQAVGQIPVSFRHLQTDTYFFPGHKWCAGPMGTGALILSEEFVKALAEPNKTKEHPTPDPQDGTSFELGTQNIGLIAGFAKACSMKHQEGLQNPALDKIREKWKTCLQRYQGMKILEWEGPHAPGILSMVCLEEKTGKFMQAAASAHSLAWKTFAHPSYPSKLSIRISWSTTTPPIDIHKAFACFSSSKNA